MNEFLEHYSSREEGQHFDRKEAKLDNKKLLSHIVGFANAEGGTLVLGISDDGRIIGCRNRGKDEYDIERLISNDIVPPISVEVTKIEVPSKKDYVLEIIIPPVTDKVVKIRDSEKVYLRQSDSTDELKYDQIKKLQYDKGQISYEDEIEYDFDHNDLNEDLFDLYRERMNTSQSNEEILDVRTASSKGKYTKTAVLLFSKNPCKYITNARVRFIRYDGIKSETGTRLNIIKEESFELPLPLLIEEVKNMVKSQLRDFVSLDENGLFITVPEYPEFAWLEGIVNAVVHRDYSVTGDCIKIFMYDDRLEILSPGKLPSIITINNLKYTRFSRNPRIARLMSDFGYVKELNEGVKRIYEEMEDFFLEEPEFHEPGKTAVQLRLKNNIVMRSFRRNDQISDFITNEKMSSLSKDEKKIIQYIYPSKTITIKIANEILGKKGAYSRKILTGLRQKGILHWHGSSTNDPTQYYSLYEE